MIGAVWTLLLPLLASMMNSAGMLGMGSMRGMKEESSVAMVTTMPDW